MRQTLNATMFTSRVARGAMLLVVCLLFVSRAWAQTQSNREEVLLPAVAGYTLQPGKMYVVSNDMEIIATYGNGLNVAAKGSEQAPILYIPAGVTLTVKGADAHGVTGAGAGIFVPSNAELIITGEGKLIATGGNAANGGDAEDGQNGGNKLDATQDFQMYDTELLCSGKGGDGGYGGGGAGAGIGGNGGVGGVGGVGGAAVYFTAPGESKASQKNGLQGSNGGNGSAGTAAGKISITGTINVVATPGTAGTVGGKGGKQGWSTMRVYDNAYNVAGAGGGGAGGGAGFAAPCGIGAGGPGGGGGSAGGSGAVDWAGTWMGKPSKTNDSGRAESGDIGGKGAVDGAPGDNSRARDEGAQVFGYSKQGGKNGKAGVGGKAGAAATAADYGTLYVSDGADVNVEGGTNPSDFKGDYKTDPSDAPDDMKFNIILKDADGNQVGSPIEATIGEPLPAISTIPYTLTHTDTDGSEMYFAGYYTSEEGQGDRIYKGIDENGDGKLDIAKEFLLSASEVILYPHFIHAHHIINWDYCYSDGEAGGASTWKNINTSEYLNHGKLLFYHTENGQRTLLKEVLMTAYYGTGLTSDATFIYKDSPSAGLQNHTRAVGDIHLHVGSSADQLNSKEQIDVYFTDEQLSQFNDYDFIPCEGDGSSIDHWQTITDHEQHQTVFSYTGANAENQYTLQWSVMLQGLQVYPSNIFAKPMYWDGDSWEMISQLPTRYNGVTCYAAQTHVGGDIEVADSYVVYTGEYPVWIKDDSDEYWKYRVGLVGFTLNGHIYYMDATQGNVHSDMISPETILLENDNIGTAEDVTKIISYPKPASTIPVLRLMPNGGQLDDDTPFIYVNESRSNDYSLNGYRATRAGYKLSGWNTKADGSGDAYAIDGTAVSKGGAALTLHAMWEESVPPVIATEGITFTETGATIRVSVTDNDPEGGVEVYYIISDTKIDDLEGATWTDKVTDEDGDNIYDIEVNDKTEAYIYIKAVDDAGNVTYASSGDTPLKTDGIAPTYVIYPERNVCNFYCEITVEDNIALDKIYIKHKETESSDAEWVDYTTTFEIVGGNANKKYYRFAKPSSDSFTDGTGWYSLKVTDAAGNETVHENYVHMIYDHNWDTAHPHTTIVKEEDDTFTTHTYYDCLNGCEHIWDETTIGAAPNDPTDGYKHDSGKTDATEKLHQEQGLMRDETTNFLGASGTVIIEDNDGHITGVGNDINSAIEQATDGSVILLVDDAPIKTGETANTIATPAGGAEITIDLNGNGLLVNDAPGNITGNANVTLLLKDNGTTEYTNRSEVSGTPISYHRDFAASVRAGNWQALYLPFAVTTLPAGYDFGKILSVEVTSEEGNLVIDKEVDALSANTSYFVRSSDGKVDIDITSGTLKAYATPAKTDITDGYSIEGSLKNTDNVASAGDQFWVLTNGGQFWFAKSGSHQRPYHWVINAPAESSVRAFMLYTLGEDYTPTAIEHLEAAQNAKQIIYTISGTRITNASNLKAGVYIMNGRKVVIK